MAMKIGVVIEGLFSFLLSHLLKLGGSFEISHGHLASPVPGSTVAPEGRGKPGCICVTWVFQPGPGRQESRFFFSPHLNEKPLCPLLQVPLPWPQRVGSPAFWMQIRANLQVGKGAAES